MKRVIISIVVILSLFVPTVCAVAMPWAGVTAVYRVDLPAQLAKEVVKIANQLKEIAELVELVVNLGDFRSLMERVLGMGKNPALAKLIDAIFDLYDQIYRLKTDVVALKDLPERLRAQIEGTLQNLFPTSVPDLLEKVRRIASPTKRKAYLLSVINEQASRVTASIGVYMNRYASFTMDREGKLKERPGESGGMYSFYKFEERNIRDLAKAYSKHLEGSTLESAIKAQGETNLLMTALMNKQLQAISDLNAQMATLTQLINTLVKIELTRMVMEGM